jgi:8-oxo-dGTP diphosphatase
MAQKHYLIAAAVIRDDDHVLLVQQQARHDAAAHWALPGGVVEEGELLTEALVREVHEETGLDVQNVGHVAYIAQLDNPDEHYQSLTFVFEVGAWSGTPRPADPDDLISSTQFCTIPDALDKLQALPWLVMGEPLVAYLHSAVSAGSLWLYRQQADGSQYLVTKLAQQLSSEPLFPLQSLIEVMLQ